MGDTLLIRGIWALIAMASARTRLFVPRGPVLTPLTARPPASIQTKLSPRFCSCCSTRACPALPMATTQMTAAIPMVTPRIVRRLRILFRRSARAADRNRALRLKIPAFRPRFTVPPSGKRAISGTPSLMKPTRRAPAQ